MRPLAERLGVELHAVDGVALAETVRGKSVTLVMNGNCLLSVSLSTMSAEKRASYVSCVGEDRERVAADVAAAMWRRIEAFARVLQGAVLTVRVAFADEVGADGVDALIAAISVRRARRAPRIFS